MAPFAPIRAKKKNVVDRLHRGEGERGQNGSDPLLAVIVVRLRQARTERAAPPGQAGDRMAGRARRPAVYEAGRPGKKRSTDLRVARFRSRRLSGGRCGLRNDRRGGTLRGEVRQDRFRLFGGNPKVRHPKTAELLEQLLRQWVSAVEKRSGGGDHPDEPGMVPFRCDAREIRPGGTAASDGVAGGAVLLENRLPLLRRGGKMDAQGGRRKGACAGEDEDRPQGFPHGCCPPLSAGIVRNDE